ncbi:Uncharacterised protein [Bordetella pertussis]|nr:Uncharacterised protein [Bordetella pertussis]
MPADAYVSALGSFLASAMTWAIELTGTSGPVMTTLGSSTSWVTGSKACLKSNGRSLYRLSLMALAVVENSSV